MSTAASAVASSKQWLQSLFQQKGATRPLKFQMQLTIHELEQYPQSSTLFVKWKDGSGNSGETGVVGGSVSSSGHQYTWDASFSFLASFLVDNHTNIPLPRMLHLSVRQVNVRTGSVKRIGVVDANLSEFLCALPRQAAYVLCDSKANAMIRVSLCAKQLMGDPLFRCPLQAQEDISPPPVSLSQQHRRRSLSATPAPPSPSPNKDKDKDKDKEEGGLPLSTGGTGAGTLGSPLSPFLSQQGGGAGALLRGMTHHGQSRSLALPPFAFAFAPPSATAPSPSPTSSSTSSSWLPPSRPLTLTEQQQKQEQRRSFSYAEFARFVCESRVLRDSLDLSTSGPPITTTEQGPSSSSNTGGEGECGEDLLEVVERRLEQMFATPHTQHPNNINEQPPPTPPKKPPKPKPLAPPQPPCIDIDSSQDGSSNAAGAT